MQKCKMLKESVIGSHSTLNPKQNMHIRHFQNPNGSNINIV